MSEEVVESAPIEAAPEAEITQEAVSESQEENPEAAPITEESTEVAPEIQANTEAELESEIQDAIEEGASEEEVKDMIRQFTLKVDGKEFIKEIDLSDMDAIKNELQKAHKGQKSTQELAELKKLYSAELQRLRQDPFGVLKEMDPEFDALQLSADFINKKFAEEEMSPEEKAQQAAALELEELRAERDRLKQAAEKRDQDAQDAQVAAEIEDDIMSALDSDNELIADKETVRLVAKELHFAMKNGYYDLTAKDVLPTVKDQLKQQFRNSAKRLKTTAALKEYMGEDLTNKLREERLQQAQKQVKSVNSISSDVVKPSDKSPEPRKKISLSDMMSGRK